MELGNLGIGRQNDGTVGRTLFGAFVCGEARELALEEDGVPQTGPAEPRTVLPAQEFGDTGFRCHNLIFCDFHNEVSWKEVRFHGSHPSGDRRGCLCGAVSGKLPARQRGANRSSTGSATGRFHGRPGYDGSSARTLVYGKRDQCSSPTCISHGTSCYILSTCCGWFVSTYERLISRSLIMKFPRLKSKDYTLIAIVAVAVLFFV